MKTEEGLLNWFPAQNNLVFCCSSAGIFSDLLLFTTPYVPYVGITVRLPTSDFLLPTAGS